MIVNSCRKPFLGAIIKDYHYHSERFDRMFIIERSKSTVDTVM